MGRLFYHEQEVFRETILRCDEYVRKYLGWSLQDDFSKRFPSSQQYRDEERIQPAMTTLQIATSDLLRSQGVRPSAVAGLSMGELAAGYTAEVLTLQEAMKISCCVSKLTRWKLSPGQMAFTRLSASETRKILKQFDDRAVLAVELSPAMNVISGPESVIGGILATLNERGVRCGRIQVGFAFHSPEVLSLKEPFFDYLQQIRAESGSVPMYSSVTGLRHDGTHFDHEYWWQIYHRPARFHSLIISLLADGFDTFVEVGPHPTLLQAINDTARASGKVVVVVCGMKRDQDDRSSWEEAKHKLRAAQVKANGCSHPH